MCIHRILYVTRLLHFVLLCTKQIQLARDPNNPELYLHILVDQVKLSQAKRRAHNATSGNALTLLNRVIDLAFSKEELVSVQGPGLRPKDKGVWLDKVKVDVVKGK